MHGISYRLACWTCDPSSTSLSHLFSSLTQHESRPDDARRFSPVVDTTTLGQMLGADAGKSRTLSVADVANRLRVGPERVRQLARQGMLKHDERSGANIPYRLDRADVEKYVREHPPRRNEAQVEAPASVQTQPLPAALEEERRGRAVAEQKITYLEGEVRRLRAAIQTLIADSQDLDRIG